MLRSGSFVILFIVWHASHAEKVFRNFSCVTYNWNIDLRCSWTEPTSYGSDLITDVTWYMRFGSHEPLRCPSSTATSCTWDLGGGGGRYDVDPGRQILVCLQLRTPHGVAASMKECHNVDIANAVKPAAVSDIEAISTSPLCLTISWIHEKTVDAKTYSLQLQSDREEIVQEVESTEDPPSSGYYRHVEYYHICNLTYYTNYTLSVRTRPLNYDHLPTGYWSDVRAINKVTPKSVPSRSPNLLPGAYTLAPVNVKGYRTVTIYWLDLPRHSWNGENLTYITKASTVKPCRQQTLNLQRAEALTEFEILSNCSYTILVWSKNEIGQSDEPSKMYIEHEELNPPQDVFMYATKHSDQVEISWQHYNEATMITIYWCRANPARSCRSGFYSKTVRSMQNSTSVTFAGFPEVAYIFGASAESVRNNRTVSSGFQWTDCSTILPRVLRSPIIHFRGVPQEKSVSVSWVYSYCNTLLMKQLQDKAEYQVNVSTSSQHYRRILKGNTNSFHLYNIPSGVEVCVSITARLNNMSQQASPFNCYTQGQQGGAGFPIHIVVSVLCSVIGLLVVITSACVTRKICRWWRKQIAITLPKCTAASEASETLMHSSSNKECGRSLHDIEDMGAGDGAEAESTHHDVVPSQHPITTVTASQGSDTQETHLNTAA